MTKPIELAIEQHFGAQNTGGLFCSPRRRLVPSHDTWAWLAPSVMQVLGQDVRGEAHEIVMADEIFLRGGIEILLEKIAPIDGGKRELVVGTNLDREHVTYLVSGLSPQHSHAV